MDILEAQPHVISELEKLQRGDISTERNDPHNYNTRSITKRFKHLPTFKTEPNMFKTNGAEKITVHKVKDYIAYIEPKKIHSQ